jgi:hypothetical protein
MRKLLDFKLQTDDVLHRQISTKADLLGLDDTPPRAWSTGSYRNVRANNSRQMSAFPRKPLVKYRSRRLRGNVMEAAASAP